MSKRGFFMSLPADIVGWFILFLGVIIWALIFSIFGSTSTYQIKEQSVQIDNKAVLINYLRTPVGEENIADLIIKVYNGEDKTKLVNEIDLILNRIFEKEQGVCWKLWYYDQGNKKKLLAETNCGKKINLFDAETTIPTPDGDKLRIRLSVPGYKK